MDNFSKLMADLLEEGKTLEEAVRALTAKAAKEVNESFAKSEFSAHLGYKKGGKEGEQQGGREAKTAEEKQRPSWKPGPDGIRRKMVI